VCIDVKVDLIETLSKRMDNVVRLYKEDDPSRMTAKMMIYIENPLSVNHFSASDVNYTCAMIEGYQIDCNY
jgi:hypothetical protein